MLNIEHSIEKAKIKQLNQLTEVNEDINNILKRTNQWKNKQMRLISSVGEAE